MELTWFDARKSRCGSRRPHVVTLEMYTEPTIYHHHPGSPLPFPLDSPLRSPGVLGRSPPKCRRPRSFHTNEGSIPCNELCPRGRAAKKSGKRSCWRVTPLLVRFDWMKCCLLGLTNSLQAELPSNYPDRLRIRNYGISISSCIALCAWSGGAEESVNGGSYSGTVKRKVQGIRGNGVDGGPAAYDVGLEKSTKEKEVYPFCRTIHALFGLDSSLPLQVVV